MHKFDRIQHKIQREKRKKYFDLHGTSKYPTTGLGNTVSDGFRVNIVFSLSLCMKSLSFIHKNNLLEL